MAGEIDNLEIKISAESEEAARHINALADSMWELQNSAVPAGKGMQTLARSLGRIDASFAKTDGIKQALDDLESSVERINNIKVGGGFDDVMKILTDLRMASADIASFKIDKEFTDGISRIAKAAEVLNDVDFSGMKEMQDVLSKMPENVRVSFGASNDEVSRLRTSLDDVRGNISDITKALDSLSTHTKDVVSATSNAKDDIIGKATTKSTATDITAGAVKDSFFFRSGKDLEYVQKAAEATTSALRSVSSVIGGALKSAASTALTDIKSLGGALLKLDYSVAVRSIKAIMSPLTSIGKKFSSAATKASQFLASIKRIAMYRVIRSAIKAITEGFEEGRKNLYYYSQAVGTDFAPSMDKAATAALYLKNSIGAATAPLTNYLVPMIDAAVDHIVDLINKFNELTAAITGAQTWTKALKYPTQWQDALDDTNKSAKKLKSTMLGFDELNVIEPLTPSAKSAALDMEDYSKMFQEMQTSSTWKNNIPEMLVPVKLAWDSEGDNTIQTIKNTWREILGLIGSVRDSFRTVWENGTGQRTLELTLQIVQNIVGAFGGLAKNIKKAWDEGGKGTKIIQSVWNVANNLLTVFRDIWGSIREWAEGLNWTPLLEALGKLGDAIDKLTNPESGAMQLLKGLWEDVLLPLGKWTIEEAAPAAIDAFASAIETLSAFIDDIQPGLKWVWDNFFEPIAEWSGSKLVDDLKSMKDLLDQITKLLKGEESIEEAFNLKTDKGKENTNKLAKGLSSITSPFTKFSLLNPDSATWAAIKKAGAKLSGGNDTNQSLAGISLNGSNAGVMENPYLAAMQNGENGDDIEQAHFFKDFADNFKSGLKEIEDAIASSTLGQFFTNLFDSTQDFGVWLYEFTHETWPQFWGGIGEKLFDAVDSFKTAWSQGLDDIKKRVSDVWTAIKKTLSDGWNKITGFVTSYVADWKSGFDDISTKVSDTWHSITGWISDNMTWENMKSKVSDFSGAFTKKFSEIRNTVSTKFTEIKDTVTGFFGDLEIFKKAARFRDDILDFFGGILGKDENSGVRGKFNEIKNTIVGVFENITQSVKSPLNDAISGIETFANSVIDAIGGILQGFKSLTGGARAAFEKATGISLDFGWSIPYINLPRLEKGGLPDVGDLFIANEAGPELVGRFGNQTAVMNNQQIVEAVSNGVYRAMSQALANNSSDKASEIHIYLDRQEITKQIGEQESANGIPIFGNLVYN